jgi:hypothetical protein
LGGSSSAALEHAELMKLFLPVIRADLEACDTYQFESEEPFAHPIAAIAGAGDSGLSAHEVCAWNLHTSSHFSMCTLPGDHFSMLNPPEMLLTLSSLIQELAKPKHNNNHQYVKEKTMNELVRKLSEGNHPVEASVRPKRTPAAFKEAIDRGYVHILFTGTRGGTELGFALNKDLSDFREADFTEARGRMRVCGDLTLDYERVRCVADLDVTTLKGTGHLDLLAN